MMRVQSSLLMGAAGLVMTVGSVRAEDCVACTDCEVPRPEDTLMCGCDAFETGEIGIGSLVGNVNETVAVPITITTHSVIDAFTIDLRFPEGLVEFASISTTGTLVADWTFVAGNAFPNGVRVGGFGGAAEIPSGVSGTLVILNLTVSGQGCDGFCFLSLLDDVKGYTTCASSAISAPGDDRVTASWGRVKSAYRE
jgi:hypothetical protein